MQPFSKRLQGALSVLTGKSSWFERNQPAPRGMGGSINEVPIQRFVYSQDWMHAYESVSWVYACVNLISASLAGRPMKLTSKDEEIDEHPVLQLLAQPNMAQTGFEFIQMVQQHIELAGNAVILCDQMDGYGRPRFLYLLDPTKVRPVVTVEGLIGYVMRVQGVDVPFTLLDIILIKNANPHNMWWGMGTVEAAASTLDSDVAMDDWNRGFFQNGARFSGILTTEQTISETAFDAIAAQWQQMSAGARNAYRTAILESGLKYQPLSVSQSDMGLIDLRKFSRDEILSMFNVPGSKLGLMEYAGYKQNEADQTFWQEGMSPRTARVDSGLTALARRWDPSLVITHELPSFDNEVQRIELIARRAATGIYTVNELRAMDNLPPLLEGDVVYGASSMAVTMQGTLKPEEQTLSATIKTIEGTATALPLDKKALAERTKRHREKIEQRTLERFQPVLQQVFDEQEQDMRKALARRKKAAGQFGFTVDDIYDEEAAREGLRKALTALHDRVGYEVWLEQRNAGLHSAAWDRHEAAGQIKTALAGSVPGIARTTRDALEEQFSIASKRGYSIDQLANGYPSEGFRGLAGVFEEAKTTRNQTIIRTETATTYNLASVAGYRVSGKVSGVQVFDGTDDGACAAVHDSVQSLPEKCLRVRRLHQ